MIYKDALILSFFIDQDDPEELEQLEGLKKSLAAKLRASKLGRYDEDSFDAKGQCFKIELLGNDAEAMLQALVPEIRDASFLIGPKATLIMRSYEQGSNAAIKHVDL